MTSYICDNELKTTGQLACYQLSNLLLHRYFRAHLIQMTNYYTSPIFWVIVSWIIEHVNVKSMNHKGLLCWFLCNESCISPGCTHLAITSYLTLVPSAHLRMHAEGSASSDSLRRMLGTLSLVSLLLSRRRISHVAVTRVLWDLISILAYVTMKQKLLN